MKQQRYLDKDGKRDWIDKCADEMTLEEFRGAMKFTIGKYYRRLGKKDPVEQEQAKIDDYKRRWVVYEFELNSDSLGMAPSEAIAYIRDMVNLAVEELRALASEARNDQ